MGGGASCCGGKSTDIVESTKPPLERRSIGVGDNRQTTSTATGNDTENSSEDSGRVSPTPSTVTIDSVYTLQEGDRYIKSPEPERSEINNNTSDYDSSTSSGATHPSPNSSVKRTGKHNHRSTGLKTGDHSRNNINSTRRYPTQPHHSSSSGDFTAPQNRQNKSPSQSQQNRDYMNPGYVGSIGSNHPNPGTQQHNRHGQRIHTLQSDSSPSGDSKPSATRKNWGTGYRLGNASDSNDTNITRSRSDVGYVPSTSGSTRSNRSHAINTSQNGPYQLDDNSQSREGQQSRSGFIGHQPLTSRSSSLNRSRDDMGLATPANLSISGQAMQVYGERRSNSRSNDQNRQSQQYQRAESFFLPMSSLVSSPSTMNKSGNKKNRRRKQGGDAFMITFDGNDSSTVPINNDDLSTSGTDEDDDDIQLHNPDSAGFHSFGDYSYNLSRSSSRSTTLSDINRNGTPTGSMPSTSTQNSRGRNIRTTPIVGKNPESKSNYKTKPRPPVPTASVSGYSSRPEHTKRSNHQTPNKVDGNTSRVGHVQAWRNKRNQPSRNSDIEALNQHINDLRQLLSMHMRQQPLKRKKSVNSTTPDDQTRNRSNDNEDLVQKLQSEIVQLENKLCEKEEEIQRLVDGQPGEDSSPMQSEVGTQAGQQMAEIGTDVQDEMDTLVENYEQILTDLDNNAVQILNHAKETAVSEEEFNNILEEHIQSRDLLRKNMMIEKQKLDDKLKQKLENKNRIPLMGEIVSKSSRNNNDGTESKNNIQTHNTRKPVPIRTFDDSSSSDTNPWKPGLFAIGEGDENTLNKGHRVRSNTFTKDENDSTDDEEKEHNDTEKLADSGTKDTGVALHGRKNTMECYSPNVMETQTDMSGDVTRLSHKEAVTSTSSGSDHMVLTSECGTDTHMETADMGTDTDPSAAYIHRLTTDLINTVENIPKELESRDEQFIKNVWNKQQDKMTAEELHQLLKQHMQDQNEFEKAKISELERQQKNLLQKMKDRKRVHGSGSDEEGLSGDDEVEEIVESINDTINALTVNKESTTQTPTVNNFPASNEDLHHLLQQHRREKEDLMESLLQNKLKQLENIQRKALLKSKNRLAVTHTDTCDMGVGMELEQKSQGVTTHSTQGVSIETNTDPVPKRGRLPKDSDSVDINGVLKEHRDRVNELRQIKQEYGRMHQEKVQERLSKRLKKKNKQNREGTVEDIGSDVEE